MICQRNYFGFTVLNYKKLYVLSFVTIGAILGTNRILKWICEPAPGPFKLKRISDLNETALLLIYTSEVLY